MGVLALVIASLGLLLAIIGADIAEAIEPTPPIEEKIADVTVRIKDTVLAKLKNREAVIAPQESSFSWHEALPKAGLVLAALGLMIGGASSYARGENRAFAVSAGSIGAVALAWQALMVGLGVILLIVIVFVVLNAMGLDISF